MKRPRITSKKYLWGLLLVLLLVLTSCVRNAPTAQNTIWNEAQWDNSTWQ